MGKRRQVTLIMCSYFRNKSRKILLMKVLGTKISLIYCFQCFFFCESILRSKQSSVRTYFHNQIYYDEMKCYIIYVNLTVQNNQICILTVNFCLLKKQKTKDNFNQSEKL